MINRIFAIFTEKEAKMLAFNSSRGYRSILAADKYDTFETLQALYLYFILSFLREIHSF